MSQINKCNFLSLLNKIIRSINYKQHITEKNNYQIKILCEYINAENNIPHGNVDVFVAFKFGGSCSCKGNKLDILLKIGELFMLCVEIINDAETDEDEKLLNIISNTRSNIFIIIKREKRNKNIMDAFNYSCKNNITKQEQQRKELLKSFHDCIPLEEEQVSD